MPPVDSKALRSLARRFAYEKWSGRNRLDEDLVVWNFQPSGRELPGGRLASVREIQAPDWPRALQIAWRPRGRGKSAQLALVDAYECSSRSDAHEFTLALLGQLESPQVKRRDDLELGDVAFTDDAQGAILFVRANLVLLARNAERERLPIRELSARLDRELVEKPRARAVRYAPEIERFAAPEGLARRRRVPLELKARDPRERPLWYKCFASSGRLSVSQGQLVYEHTAPGPPDVTVYAIAPSGAATKRRLDSDALKGPAR